MTRNYRIKKGRHRAWPSTVRVWWDKRIFRKSVCFHSDCAYLLAEADRLDANKLFGFGYAAWYRAIFYFVFGLFGMTVFAEQHKKDSARFGWYYDKVTGKIMIVAYCYVDRERINIPLCLVDLGKQVVLQIHVLGHSYFFSVDGITYTYSVPFKHKHKFQFGLGVYFGGNQRAPQTMNIEMKNLE